jgi:transcription antitermination factor NusG
MPSSVVPEIAPPSDENKKSSTYQSNTYLPEQLYEKRWYVVYTRNRHEKFVAEQCTQRNVMAFLPLYRVLRKWKQRRAEVLFPLFPSYVFIRIALQERLRILALPGIISLVSFKGIPAVIPESQIDSLSRAITLGRAEPHVYLHSGTRVRVTAGPLVGLEGIVVEIKNRVQVIVSFEWMARSVAVSLDAADMETLR